MESRGSQQMLHIVPGPERDGPVPLWHQRTALVGSWGLLRATTMPAPFSPEYENYVEDKCLLEDISGCW